MSVKGVSIFNKYIELIAHYLNNGEKISVREISRLIIKANPDDSLNIETLRSFVGKQKKKGILNGYIKTDLETKSETKSNEYKKKNTPVAFVLSAWNNETGLMMDIDEYCSHYNLPRKDVRSYKLVSHTGTPFYNIVFNETLDDNFSKNFDEIIDKSVSKHIRGVRVHRQDISLNTDVVDRLVYSDVHIGMNVNPDGYSLYGGKWDEKELMDRCDIMINTLLKNRVGGELYLEDLGDLLDGWNGETTRGGHKLPQNMDNEEAFDVALKFKMKIIDELIPFYDKIHIRNICNDNHAGSFAYVLNSAYKKIIKEKYGLAVDVVNQRKFIDYYLIGDHAIVCSHGKESTHLKFGFKPHLDTKQIEKIDQYLKSEEIYQKAKYIEFSKGDSHQALFDMSGSIDFDYFNYPSFSPSSGWVQTNFSKGKSGFVIQHINKWSSDKDIKTFWFDWKK